MIALAVSVALTVPPVVASVTTIALPVTEIDRALVAPELTNDTLTALPASFSSRFATNLIASLAPPPLIVTVSPPAVRVSVPATAAVLIEAVTPVTSVTAFTASLMFVRLELAPKKSTWLPLAPVNSIVVAELRFPPLYVSAALVAAVTTVASIVTELAEPNSASLMTKSDSLARSALVIVVVNDLLPSSSLSPANCVFELILLIALRAASICDWLAVISVCDNAPRLTPS